MIRPPASMRRRIRRWFAPLAISLALHVLALGCTHPWHVNAHAAIAAHTHAMRITDQMLAREITRSTLTGEQAQQRYGTPVRALALERARLLEAEHAVDVGEAVDNAESRCQAFEALAGALDHMRFVQTTLSEVGLAMPAELTATAGQLGAAMHEVSTACAEARR